jgi:F-type H+-transporting ATPase subunit delta
MTTLQTANFAKALFSLELPEEVVEKTKKILKDNKIITEVLENPSINRQQKEAVIDRIFDREICGFVKVLNLHGLLGYADEIFQEYDSMILERKNLLKATLFYVTKPDDDQLEQFKDVLCKKYKKTGVIMELKEDPSLIGGFVLKVGNTEYDKSIKGTLDELQKTLVRR